MRHLPRCHAVVPGVGRRDTGDSDNGTTGRVASPLVIWERFEWGDEARAALQEATESRFTFELDGSVLTIHVPGTDGRFVKVETEPTDLNLRDKLLVARLNGFLDLTRRIQRIRD